MGNIFKIGQKVVALTSAPRPTCQPRIKGNIYEVKAVRYCDKCGTQSINLGHITNNGLYSICSNCKHEGEHFGLRWTNSKRFAPVQEQGQTLAEILEELDITLEPVTVKK